MLTQLRMQIASLDFFRNMNCIQSYSIDEMCDHGHNPSGGQSDRVITKLPVIISLGPAPTILGKWWRPGPQKCPSDEPFLYLSLLVSNSVKPPNSFEFGHANRDARDVS